MSDLNYAFEVSYGSEWINLNDHERYIVHAENTSTRGKTYRQIKASSPIVEGDVLVHAVAEMVMETVRFWIHGVSSADLNDNIRLAEALFEQFSYKVRVSTNDVREIWTCQMSANMSLEMSQALLHNTMASMTVQVPRYPTLAYERLEA